MALLAWMMAGLTQMAVAQTWYLESEPATTREPVVEVAQLAAEGGAPGRVVRLYVQGTGWRYVFRSYERTESATLVAGLPAIRSKAAIGVMLIKLEDGEAVVVGDPARVAVTATPAVPADGAPDVQEALRRVARAHGGPAPFNRIDAAGAVVFRFERTLDDRRVAHTWVKRGDDAYLSVDLVSGVGSPARLGIVRSRPWMDGATADDLDVLRVREQIERFSPERVLSVPLLFSAGLPGGREFELMTIGQGERRGGSSFISLEWAGDRQTSPVRLLVDAATWRISEVIWGTAGESVRWLFTAYEELGDGAVFPTRVEIWKGSTRLDRVDVSELDLDPTLLPEWFPSP